MDERRKLIDQYQETAECLSVVEAQTDILNLLDELEELDYRIRQTFVKPHWTQVLAEKMPLRGKRL